MVASFVDFALRPVIPRNSPVLEFVLAFVFTGLTASLGSAGTSNSLMDISADGRLLACSNRDGGTVTVVDLDSHHKLHEIAVGSQPEGVSFLGASHDLAVAVYADDKVVFLDADSGQINGSVEVLDEPYGVVSNPAGKQVFVTLDYPGQVIEIDAPSLQVVRVIDVGPFLRGIAIAEEERRLYVTEFYTTTVRAIDLETNRELDHWPGIRTDNLARQVILNPRRPKAYFAHIRSRVDVAHGSGSIFPYVTVVDTRPGDGRRRTRIPMDAFLGNLVTANPWEVTVSPDGKQLYVVFAGTDDMFVCDIVDDDYREITYRAHMKVGHNPRAARVSPDNGTVYVYNALDFEIVAYDTKRLKRVAQVSVSDPPLSEEVRRGKILFYSALQPMVGRRWISCASCHPDGQPDGRTWQNSEGLRNTQSLAGLAWTHPIHWSADRDEVQDFEHTIRGKLMQGRGLIQASVQPALGKPNLGLSSDLDALAAYTNSHKFHLSPHAKNGLSTEAQRGREIFFSKKSDCVRCHRGPFYTDSIPREADSILRHDVGSGNDDPTELMGPAFDTPTLLGVYRTAPYLHHGKAATLNEVLTNYNRDDRHGVTSHLTPQEVSSLVAFLKSLPYESPEMEARKLGLTEVQR
jgi:DNA-binding beta-propeller fold protein YncE